MSPFYTMVFGDHVRLILKHMGVSILEGKVLLLMGIDCFDQPQSPAGVGKTRDSRDAAAELD